MKRTMAAVLALLLLTMSACGGGVDVKEIDVTSASRSTSAAYELVLPEYTEDLWINGFAVAGESVYFIGNSNDLSVLARYNENGESEDLCTFEVSAVKLIDIAADADGRLVVLAGGGEKSPYSLMEFDAEGAMTAEHTLDFSGIPDGWTPVKLELAGGTAFLLGGGVLCAVALDGEEKLLYSLETDPSASIALLSDGSLALGQSGKEAWKLSILEPGSGKAVEACAFNMDLDLLCGGAGRTLYLGDGASVYRFSPDDGELARLFSWSGLGIVGGAIEELPGGELLCSGRLDRSVPNGLLRIRPVTEGETESAAEPLTIASLSGTNMSFRLGEAIRSWNQKNPDWAIEIIDYSAYVEDGDTRTAELKLIADMASGNAPDMFDFGTPPYGNAASSSLYARRGLLEDLYPYLDSDAELSRDMFARGVLSSLEINGKLYELLVQYRALTGFADKNEAGSDWSYAGLRAAVEASGRYSSLVDEYRGMDYLRLAVFSSGDRLIDWENGTCGFESGYFIDMLEAAAESDDGTEDAGGGLVQDYIEKSTGLIFLMNMDSIWNVSSAANVFGEDLVYVGLPELGTVVYPECSIGMSASSAHKDKCWEFIRTFFTGEVPTIGFSMLSSELRQSADKEIQMAKEGDYIQYHPHAEWAMNTFIEELENVKAVYRYDPQLWSIVSEESAAFFAGARTAEDTAAAIQSRAEIYVAEQSA